MIEKSLYFDHVYVVEQGFDWRRANRLAVSGALDRDRSRSLHVARVASDPKNGVGVTVVPKTDCAM